VTQQPQPTPAPQLTTPRRNQESSSSSSQEQYVKTRPRILVTQVNVQPGIARAGQEVLVYANVVNRGEQAGNYKIELKINGVVEQVKTGTLEGNSGRPLSFAVNKQDPGNYQLDINGQQAYFTITGMSNQKIPAKTVFLLVFILFSIGIIIVCSLLIKRRRTGY
jgi:hypothetical protein